MADIAPIPRGLPIMRMRWMHLLFVHWRVDPAVLRPLVPDAFEIESFDGSAWIGLVPFTMEDVSPIILPRMRVRGVTDFHECNVRTYVRRGRERGVYFLSLDAASRLGVWGARKFFHLPYNHARIELHRHNSTIDYRVDRLGRSRATMRCRWRVGDVRDASEPGGLAHFLTERYQFLTTDWYGRPWRCRVWHEPWPLRNATLDELNDELVPAAGVRVPNEEPVVYHVDALDTRAWRLERLA